MQDFFVAVVVNIHLPQTAIEIVATVTTANFFVGFPRFLPCRGLVVRGRDRDRGSIQLPRCGVWFKVFLITLQASFGVKL